MNTGPVKLTYDLCQVSCCYTYRDHQIGLEMTIPHLKASLGEVALKGRQLVYYFGVNHFVVLSLQENRSV